MSPPAPAGHIRLARNLGYWALATVTAVLLGGCGGEPVEHVVELIVRDGSVIGPAGMVKAKQGDHVTLLIDSDSDATIHAHGLPETVRVKSGELARVEFTTSYVGQFDVELHPVAPESSAAGVADGAEMGGAHPKGSAIDGQMPAMEMRPVPAPPGMSVELTVNPDAVDGLNLHIQANGLDWSPEGTGQTHVPGAGHAHIYVDGKKHARAYGPWLHLSGLGLGERHIRVTLNANTHAEYVDNDRPVAAEATAEVVAGAGIAVATISVDRA